VTSREEGIYVALEMVIDDGVFAPGEEIRGRIAVTSRSSDPSDQEQPRGRRFAVSAVAVERVSPPGGQRVAERLRLPATFDAEELSGGRPARFSCPLHAFVPITYFTPRSALYWAVEATVEAPVGARGERLPDCRCEAPVLVSPLEGGPLPSQPGPPIGLEKRLRVWAEAGAPYGLSVDDGALRLTGRIATCMTAIGYVRSALTGEIRYDDLGLGLRLNGVLAEGRDHDQIRAAFDPAVGRALAAFTWAEMDDHRAIVTQWRLGERDLPEMIGDVAELAGWIGVLRRRIPPPAAMVAALAGYRALAESLCAPLTVGSMSIRGGAIDGERLDVTTLFEGATPERTALSLRLRAPLMAPLDAASSDSLAALPEEARRHLVALGREALSLSGEGQSLTLLLPEVELDADRLASLLRDLARLGRVLGERRAGGPYR
jgi:hypothetical protein